MAADLKKGWRLVDQRPRLVTSLAGGLATAFGAGVTFHRATTPWSVLPDYDYWVSITGLITEQGVTLDLARLFRHNNEHIVVIPKLIYLANYLVTSGSNIGLIVYSICAGAACAFLLLLLAQDLLRDLPARWALCGVLFPLAMFSAKLSHSYYFGMSGAIWLTADLFVILSAAALAKAAKLQSTAWLLASLLAALLGVLTYSTAIYSLLVLLVFSAVLVVRPKLCTNISREALVGVACIIVTLLIVWLMERTHPAGHPTLDFDPIRLAGFMLIYLGSALSEGYLAPVTGLAILACGTIAIRRLVANGRGRDILLWVTLFLFAPFNALMTGIGRLGFGLKAAFSSRYQSVTAISLIAAIALVLAALPKEAASQRSAWFRGATLVALLVVVIFFVANDKSIKFYADRLDKKPVVEIALRQGIAGDHHLAALRPSIDAVYRLIPALRATLHVPFNTLSRCEDFMGQRVTPASGEPAGAIERMAIYTVSHEAHTAIELSGWAVHAGKPTGCIAIVDGDGVVIGAGIFTTMRADPAMEGSLKVEWQAVASEPQHFPVCAIALFLDTSSWRPLANCQSGPR